MSTEDKFVVLVPDEKDTSRRAEDLNFLDIWDLLFARKFIIIATTIVFGALAATYALLATPVYRSQVTLAPVDEKSTAAGILGQLDGLVGLAGLDVSADRKSIDALAVLRSRDFTRAFIRDFDLLPVLFADDWDADKQAWKSEDPEDQPDLRDAVEFFSKNVRNIKEDGKTGLIFLSIEWSDPVLAARWVDALPRRLNQTLRAQSIDRATYNIEYLRKEMAGSPVVSLQQAISRLLETEMQTLMLARGNEEFAFRILDSAEVPKLRIWPMRTFIVAIGLFAGGLLSVVFVLIQEGTRRQLEARATSEVEASDEA